MPRWTYQGDGRSDRSLRQARCQPLFRCDIGYGDQITRALLADVVLGERLKAGGARAHGGAQAKRDGRHNGQRASDELQCVSARPRKSRVPVPTGRKDS